MPLPPFNISGVLPPFVGMNGPGGHASELSPYEATSLEVVAGLGGSIERRQILRGWLKYRGRLGDLGLLNGFQWLDGSFVEDKDPRDLDLVTFFRRPPGLALADLAALVIANPDVFQRDPAKAVYKLDAFVVDMDADPEIVVNVAAYFLGLFSHRRGDTLWKGMVRVRLDTAGDADAALAIDHLDAGLVPPNIPYAP